MVFVVEGCGARLESALIQKIALKDHKKIDTRGSDVRILCNTKGHFRRTSSSQILGFPGDRCLLSS